MKPRAKRAVAALTKFADRDLVTPGPIMSVGLTGLGPRVRRFANAASALSGTRVTQKLAVYILVNAGLGTLERQVCDAAKVSMEER